MEPVRVRRHDPSGDALARTIRRRAPRRSIQRKLTVGAADDPAEREADRVADDVMSVLQRSSSEEAAPFVTDPGTTRIRRIADERCPVERPVPADAVHRSAGTDGVIRRHASFEHLMLGQVDPRDLRAIPDYRGALRVQAHGDEFDIKKNHAYHVLCQERERLRTWQQAKPTSLDQVDSEWGVEAVEIKSQRGGSTICTYGEMNMLADYFGSPDELRAASAETVHKLLQTERSEYYLKLGEMLDELRVQDYRLKPEQQKGWFGSTKTVYVKYYLPEDAPLKDVYTDADYTVREGQSRLIPQQFEGDQRYTKPGADTANLITMLGLEPLVGFGGLLPKDEGLTNYYGEGRGTGTAWGVTARNACHFAPESWRSWEQYHGEALELAARASAFLETAQAPGNTEREREQYLERAQHYANEARVVNGFGDHYLQDSFASGHLINKTLIMQWYMEEIGNWYFWGPGGLEWSRLMLMSEQNQPNLAPRDYSRRLGVGAHNPQAAANLDDPEQAWQSLGLRSMQLSGGARHVLAVMRASGSTFTMDEIVTLAAPGHPVGAGQVRDDVDELMSRGLVSWTPGQDDAPDEYALVGAARPTRRAEANPDPDTATRTVTANVYHEWLQNALIQAGSGALHDHFCKQGLWVTADKGGRVFKLYGDDRMLSAHAGDGVQWAAETAQMSQQNVADVLDGATVDVARARMARIMHRFPKYVVPDFRPAKEVYNAKDFGLDQFNPPGARPLRLDDWHDELRRYMGGTYLSSLFNTWSHHFASRMPGQGHLVPFQLTSPHAGAEF